MKYQISVDQDESFKFVTTKFDVFQYTTVDTILSNNPSSLEQSSPKAAPLENSSGGHPFDFFGGTSWGGKKSGFD